MMPRRTTGAISGSAAVLTILWITASLAAVPRDAVAQRSVTVPDRVTCTSCRAQLERLVTLRTEDGPGALIAAPAAVLRAATGEYLLVDYRDRTRILVFAPDGTYRRVIGREGAGPGEFRDIRALKRGAGDSLNVYDAGRMAVLDGEGRHVRSIPLRGMVYDAVPRPDGGQVLAGMISSSERIGLPLHVLDPAGAVQQSFGSDGTFRPDYPEWGRRVIAPSADGGIWAAHRNQFVIERWSPRSVLTVRLIRRTDWFPATARPAEFTPDNPRPPLIAAIREQVDGLVAVLISVADRRKWKHDLPPPQTVRGRTVYDIPSGRGFYDTRVEWIDPGRGLVVYATALGHEIRGFIDPETVYGYWADDLDRIHVEVWRLRLHGASKHESWRDDG